CGKRCFQRIRQVVTHAVEANDASNGVDAALATATGDVDDDIDRLGDQRTRRVHRYFENQLLQAQQCAQCGTGMNGGNASGVPCTPDLDEIQCLATAHLANDYAVGA